MLQTYHGTKPHEEYYLLQAYKKKLVLWTAREGTTEGVILDLV